MLSAKGRKMNILYNVIETVLEREGERKRGGERDRKKYARTPQNIYYRDLGNFSFFIFFNPFVYKIF